MRVWSHRAGPQPRRKTHDRCMVSRVLLVLLVLVATAGAVVAYGDPARISQASDTVSKMLRKHPPAANRMVQIARGQGGEFALRAKVNGVNAPMVIDTGATSV